MIPEDEHINGILEHQGRVLISTNFAVYDATDINDIKLLTNIDLMREMVSNKVYEIKEVK